MTWTLSAKRLFTPFEVIERPRVFVDGDLITRVATQQEAEVVTVAVARDKIVTPISQRSRQPPQQTHRRGAGFFR